MTTIESLQWRYATKKFDANRLLDAKKIELLKEAFNLTATSFGLQTTKLIVVEDKEKRQPLVAYSFGQQQVVDASHLLVICINDLIEGKDIEAHFDTIKAIRNTPEHILKPHRTELLEMVTKMSKSEQQQWSTKQAYIALGNLLTVCALEQIDSCPMEGFLPDEYDRYLGLEKLGLKSVLLLPVGYRAKDDFFMSLKKVRKPLEESVIEI